MMFDIDAALHRALYDMITEAKAQEPTAEAFDVEAWLDAVSPPSPPKRCKACGQAMDEPCTAPLHPVFGARNQSFS